MMRSLLFIAVIAIVHSSLGFEPPETRELATTEESPTTPPIDINYECGGSVRVGRGKSVIEYDSPDRYEREFCVWTLVPTVDYLDVIVNYERHYLPDGDGVSIYSWNDDGNVTTNRLSNTNSILTVGNPYAAIAFSSSSNSSGRGIRITLTGSGSYPFNYRYRGFVLKQIDSRFSYPRSIGIPKYRENERVTVVVQTPNNPFTEVSVPFKDIDRDYLFAYQLYPYHTKQLASLIGTTSGFHPEGDPRLYSVSYYPRLFIFHSYNGSNTGEGFSISWNPNSVVTDVFDETY